MIAEIVNALFITYLATEYLAFSDQSKDQGDQWIGRILLKSHNVIAALCIVVWNVTERVSGFADGARNIFHGFLHAPKIILVAILYMIVLYLDCRRVSRNQLSLGTYLLKVGLAFCYVLPVYPFLAVLISCGFFFLLTIIDLLRINAALLNWPVYYGTLYGPFSFIYWKVKRSVLEDRLFLPTSSEGRRLGSV